MGKTMEATIEGAELWFGVYWVVFKGLELTYHIMGIAL